MGEKRARIQASKQQRRAAQLEASGESRYAQRQRQPWSERHRRHIMPVLACPFCAPELDANQQVVA